MSDVKPDIQEIFCEALEKKSPEKLLEFLDSACGDDANLRGQVEELLGSHDEVGNFLGGGSPAVATQIIPAITEKPGTQIGPYKLREQIGEGGFGVVYVAEQEEPVARKVALKIIKPGMDTKDVIARFGAERQTLALMDHPNIAKVLDAGTSDSGRPYFVMELIKGIPITEFCDEQKLSTRERLLLFVDVCRAVQHAHQKGIIHRDLKPSNIMVTMRDDKVIPKVIDFGVSKALSRKLTGKTVYTAHGQMIGTPLYMSPEQAQMNEIDVDIRSDVYSLGVLLYELITGTTPFDKKTLQKSGLDEMRRIIREVDPLRPSDCISTLNAKQLSTLSDKRKIDPRKIGYSYKGELDWIVMKAMEKDRDRRYESASAFATDVNRYLNDEPIEARPPSTIYRLKKFAKRNRALLTGVSLVAITLLVSAIVGSILVWNERVEAIQQRSRAEKALKETRATIDKYVETVQSAELLKEPRFKPLMKELLKDALAHYRRFVKEHEHNNSKLIELSQAMVKLAKISYQSGDLEEAIKGFKQAIEIQERLIRENSTVTEYQSNLAKSHNNIGVLYWQTGKPDEALLSYEKSLQIKERLVLENPTVTEYQSKLANSHDNIGILYLQTGKADEAWLALQKALQVRERLVRENPTVTEYQRNLASSYNNIGLGYGEAATRDQALRMQHKALAIRQRLVRENPAVAGYQRNLAMTYNHIGLLYYHTGSADQALLTYQKGLEIQERLIHENPTVTEYQSELAGTLLNMGILYGDTDKPDQNLLALQRALQIWERLVRENPTVTEYQDHLAGGHINIGHLYRDTGKPDQALVVYQKALEIQERLVRDNPTVTESQSVLAAYHNNIAWFLATVSEEQFCDPVKAIEYAKKAVELAPQEGGYWNSLGVASYRNGKFPAAIEALEKSMELRSGGKPNDWLFLSMAEWRLGNKDKASEWYDKSASWMESRKTKDRELIRFRAEAAKLLGMPVLAPRPKIEPKRKAGRRRGKATKEETRRGESR